MLLDEHTIVVERLNGEEVTRNTMLRLAISGLLSKEAGTLFHKNLDALNFETIAHEEKPTTGN